MEFPCPALNIHKKSLFSSFQDCLENFPYFGCPEVYRNIIKRKNKKKLPKNLRSSLNLFIKNVVDFEEKLRAGHPFQPSKKRDFTTRDKIINFTPLD